MAAVLDFSGSAFDIVRQPKADGVTWAWAQSDLDMASESTARAELAEVLDGDGDGAAAVLIVCLGPECFVDVRGLRLLLYASERLRKRNGQLLVVAPPLCLRRMIDLLRLSDVIPTLFSAQQAASWVRARTGG